MNVEVRLFAVARQRVGAGQVRLDLPEGATVAQLKQALAEQYPSLADVLGTVRFAVDAEYATDAARIPPGAEVACIPPVSGG